MTDVSVKVHQIESGEVHNYIVRSYRDVIVVANKDNQKSIQCNHVLKHKIIIK